MIPVQVSKQKLEFVNRDGNKLVGFLDSPADRTPTAYVLFAHCFTCSKNIVTATRISRLLAEKGMAVFRFDFTGIGESQGEFSESNFSSNIDDLVAASEFLKKEFTSPTVLIGHSLGGAAVIAVAPELPDVKAVVTIAAPSDPSHMHYLLRDSIPEIESSGSALVEIGGQEFRITSQFLRDVSEHKLENSLRHLDKALLILHSPEDQTIEIEHAYHLFDIAGSAKSFVSLENADHLLSKNRDAEYAAEVICAWVDRYLS